MCSRGFGPSNVPARLLNRLASVATQVRPSPSVAAARCAPLLREPITPGQASDLAHLLKALADPTFYALVPAVMDALSELLSTGGRAWT
jgi:hypothetical protein